ncbi:envelope-like protein, partial [Trifolium medium]|nr:envelope-like protein [Trifolium medium]
MKHGKTLAVKLPIAFPSLLCGIILNQHPEILVKEYIACKRESPLTIGARQSEGISSKTATGTMTRKEMITNLKSIITALELEEANEVT